MENLSQDITIFKADAFEILPKLNDESVDVFLTDPPFFLSNGGITCKGGKIASVDKGNWDKPKIPIETFYEEFLIQAKRILKPNGTIWVFGSMHNIYCIGYFLQKLNFKILNNITWEKSNPPPNMSCRMFTHSTENIIWARREYSSKHYFNYDLMKKINGGKQMKDVWITPVIKKSEKVFGNHPTQKPIKIIERILLASSKKGDTVLDCFMGSGTTLEACINLNRKGIGIEYEEEYYEIARKRLLNALRK